MTDLSSRSSNIIGCIPGAKFRSVESHSTWGDVEKGSHDDVGVGNAVHPFALRQSIDAIGHEPVGCFETSHATTHADPTYEVDGVVHYCVANMPGSVPVTSSQALNNATLPFGLALANNGFAAAIEDPHLRAGLNVHRGRVAVAESLGLSFSPIEDGVAA